MSESLVEGRGISHAIVVVVHVGRIVMLQAEQPKQARRVPSKQRLCSLSRPHRASHVADEPRSAGLSAHRNAQITRIVVKFFKLLDILRPCMWRCPGGPAAAGPNRVEARRRAPLLARTIKSRLWPCRRGPRCLADAGPYPNVQSGSTRAACDDRLRIGRSHCRDAGTEGRCRPCAGPVTAQSDSWFPATARPRSRPAAFNRIGEGVVSSSLVLCAGHGGRIAQTWPSRSTQCAIQVARPPTAKPMRPMSASGSRCRCRAQLLWTGPPLSKGQSHGAIGGRRGLARAGRRRPPQRDDGPAEAGRRRGCFAQMHLCRSKRTRRARTPDLPLSDPRQTG